MRSRNKAFANPLWFARAEPRRAEYVSPRILHMVYNQAINVARLLRVNLNFNLMKNGFIAVYDTPQVGTSSSFRHRLGFRDSPFCLVSNRRQCTPSLRNRLGLHQVQAGDALASNS